jgi:hypothetical protein
MFSRIRPSDLVLTGLLVALAAVLAVANVVAGVDDSDLAHPLDSQSVLIVPVFVLAALPILWRRRSVLLGIVASTLVLAASLAAFGWITRCGFALPLAAAFAYAVARFGGPVRSQLLGLGAVVLLELVTLVMDASTGGLGGLVVGLPLAAAGYGLGLAVERLSARGSHAPTLSVEHAHV